MFNTPPDQHKTDLTLGALSRHRQQAGTRSDDEYERAARHGGTAIQLRYRSITYKCGGIEKINLQGRERWKMEKKKRRGIRQNSKRPHHASSTSHRY